MNVSPVAAPVAPYKAASPAKPQENERAASRDAAPAEAKPDEKVARAAGGVDIRV